jgi:hypothetical protein
VNECVDLGLFSESWKDSDVPVIKRRKKEGTKRG